MHRQEQEDVLPEGDIVEVLSELGQVGTPLLVLLFGPQQHLGELHRSGTDR